ncbi:MAG: hypothetical protein E5Y51_30595 [Mesorhizobium sp.]|nr:MAG: hypothetical protein E5Y51_30595 [Mesorhizobium sp.]
MEIYVAQRSEGWTLQQLINAGKFVTAGASIAIVIRSSICRRYAIAWALMRQQWNLWPNAVCGGRRITLTYSPVTSRKDLNKSRR